MNQIPKITLDTNCLINLFDQTSPSRESVEDLEAILKAWNDGKADICITSRVEFDLEHDKNFERMKAMFGHMAVLPKIGTLGRWDVTKWDNGDFWADENSLLLEERVRKTLFPNFAETNPRYRNELADIDHVVGHIYAHRDIFVTSDKDILKRSPPLKASDNLSVMKPIECRLFLEEKN